MKTLLVWAAVVCSLICWPSFFASAQTTAHAPAQDKRAETEVRKLSAEEVEAFLHKDPKVMARLWSDDLVVTNPLNKFVNKQQVLEWLNPEY